LSITVWCGWSRAHTAVSLAPEDASRGPEDQQGDGAGDHTDVSADASTPVPSGWPVDHIVIALH
jgi:hypothetical protein